MKRLGIIGGLGPMATAYFFELLTGMTSVKKDQEHMPVLIQSIPDTPDRTAYILDHSQPNPLPNLIKAGKSLKEQGAEYLAIPCVTAHYFYEELCEQVGLPIIPLIEETALEFESMNVTQVGILATSGTVSSGLIQSVLDKHDIQIVIPEEEDQQKIMEIIYEQIKAGKEVDMDSFYEVCHRMKEKGAQKLLLGCTELSLIKREHVLGKEFVDVLDILAKSSIRYNGMEVMEEYHR